MAGKLIVKNKGTTSVTILTHTIVAGGTYDVGDSDLVSFAKDAQLRILLLNNLAELTVLTKRLQLSQAAEWCNNVAAGTIVYA